MYAQIKQEYFNNHKDQFVKEIIQAISTDDFSTVIESVTATNMNQLPVCSWKETLAYVIAYEDDEKLKEVAKDLGDQLLKQKKDINSAIICYIISKELSIVTDLWKKRALYQIRKLGIDKNEALFHLFQKTILLRSACGQQQSNEDVDLIVGDFSEFLNAEQQSFIAMKYLASTSSVNQKVQNLKHKLFCSNVQIQRSFQQPQMAYIPERINIQVQ